MSQINPFLDILTKAKLPANLRQPVLDVLDEFCAGIELYWQGKIRCKRAVGYPTNYGQEYRVVVQSTRGYEHTLLRAYVPEAGHQIKVDFYESELVDYADATRLKEGLELFLAKPETQDAISAYAQG